jgi:hypothetical protein
VRQYYNFFKLQQQQQQERRRPQDRLEHRERPIRQGGGEVRPEGGRTPRPSQRLPTSEARSAAPLTRNSSSRREISDGPNIMSSSSVVDRATAKEQTRSR